MSIVDSVSKIGQEYPVNQELLDWEKGADIKTLPELIRRTVDKYGERNYMGKREGNEYVFKTYNEVYQEIIYFASALIKIGCQREDRIANFSSNCLEWPVIDFGSAHVGCIHVPMYATLSQSELAHIVKDSGAKVIFALTEEHLQKILSVEDELPELEHIITSAPINDSDSSKRLWSWNDFLEFGRVHLENTQGIIEDRVGSLKATDVTSIIYTSGTTGISKGVMLMHGNFCSQLPALEEAFNNIDCHDIDLSFLPVSHVFERMFFYFFTHLGVAVGLARGLMTVLQDMQILRPTVFISVPALYIKIYEKAIAGMTGVKQKPFHWAMKVGRSYNANKRMGKVDKAGKLLHALSRKMLFSNLVKKFGGRMKTFISGGAPLPVDVCDFFLNLGFIMREGYGLTETSPVLTFNMEDNIHPGSVGQAINNVSVKIADDGEILVKGPNVMRGYYKMPEATREVFNSEGWFCTGDVGYLDEGILYITDRKKNLLVLANGKNVAPNPIELALSKSEWIDRAVVVGNNRTCVGAVIVPSFEKIRTWAEKRKINYSTNAEILQNEELQELLLEEINKACESFSNFEKVKRYYLADRDFSFAMGELTPSQKVKRRAVEKNFAEQVEEMFKK